MSPSMWPRDFEIIFTVLPASTLFLWALHMCAVNVHNDICHSTVNENKKSESTCICIVWIQQNNKVFKCVLKNWLQWETQYMVKEKTTVFGSMAFAIWPWLITEKSRKKFRKISTLDTPFRKWFVSTFPFFLYSKHIMLQLKKKKKKQLPPKISTQSK